MFALALPDGRMYAPRLAATLTHCPMQAATWKSAESASLARDKANAQRTHLEPRFELVTLFADADVVAA